MKRVFSGARPTGRQHIGNYLGAIQNYVKLQNEGNYQCIYCVVDVHALTTMDDFHSLQDNIREMVLDWLASGLDPEKSLIFVQSHVPEVMQLHTLFSMITPLGWLLRIPTFKEKARQQPHNINYGLVGYPVLMAADILLYKAEVVPVGEDQLPHIELTQELARRFNNLCGPVFPEPQALLSSTPLILGLDGKQKMSKSLDNHIEIAASPQETKERVLKAFTDPTRLYRHQPGHPETCNIFTLHKFFSPEHVERIYHECTHAILGCVEDKEFLAEQINQKLAPFRKRRQELASNPGLVWEALSWGAERARKIARETILEVREKMGLGRVTL